MLKNKKTSYPSWINNFTIAVVVAYAALILIGTFFDTQIAQAVYDSSSWWATFFQIFGELMASIVFLFSLNVLMLYAVKYVDSILAKILAVIGSQAFAISYILTKTKVAVIYMSFPFYNLAHGYPIGYTPENFDYSIPSDFDNVTTYTIYVIFYLLMLAASILYFCKKDKIQAKYAAKVGLIAIACTEIINYDAFKTLAGRWRPLQTVVNDSQYTVEKHDFTAWYQWTGQAGQSHPSGHAVEMTLVVLLTLFISVGNYKLRKIALIFDIICIASIIYGRMALGCHFLTDVAIGSMLAIGTIFCLAKIFGLKLFYSLDDLYEMGVEPVGYPQKDIDEWVKRTGKTFTKETFSENRKIVSKE